MSNANMKSERKDMEYLERKAGLTKPGSYGSEEFAFRGNHPRNKSSAKHDTSRLLVLVYCLISISYTSR